jgi:hypothetical protein
MKKDPNLVKLTEVGNTTEWEEKLEKNPEGFENEIIEYVKERFFSCGNSFEFFATIDGEFQSFSYNFNEERNIVEKRTIIGSEAIYEDVRKPVL